MAAEGTCGTYREFDRRVSRLVRHRAGLGAMTEEVVGLLAERSPRFLAGMLGIFASGGTFLPLDPAFPSIESRPSARWPPCGG